MCRHLGRIGPPQTLARTLLDPEHGLLRQSYAPADMRGGGTINADGYGVGWYPQGPGDGAGPGGAGGTPVRLRSARPLWSDTSFAALAGTVRTGAVLAAVRSATVGMPVVETAAAPFTDGRWLFSHNGVVRGWPDSLAGPASALPVRDLITLDAPTDSAVLWALVRAGLRGGTDPAAVLSGICEQVEAAAPGSRLNLLLTDGTTLWATAWRHALAVRTRDHAVTVASEPTEDFPDWTRVPDRHLVVARPGRHDLYPLAGP
ncbi:ergothioneine biosynthesis protein EgtC [Pseudonocardia sp. NPDC049635]|uniref:ergothioneine biosynthesis protein EgtC n=1 Tax=Pseudonocardia sp. NPDC049635 TaxID=3155506 RepID=UPI0033D82610